MDFRNRAQSFFNRKEPDVMGWFADLNYWHDAHKTIGDLPPKWQGEKGQNEMHADLQTGQYIPGTCAYDQLEDAEVKCEVTQANGKQIRSWQTPVGNLRDVQEYSPISFSWGFTEHAVKKAADLKVVRYILENRSYKANYEKVIAMDNDRAERGFTMMDVPGSPMAELFKWWVGISDLTYMLFDEPSEIYKTLDVLGRCQDEIYNITANAPGKYIMINENGAADVMGGLFDLHSRDYLTRRISQMHKYGKTMIIHVDGKLRGLVEKIPNTGVDCLDAITPKPVGDVGIDEIRNLVGNDILIIGGLPGAMFAPPFTLCDMEKQVMEIINLHKKSQKFMLGVADQVPPNGSLEAVKLVGRLVEKYGKY